MVSGVGGGVEESAMRRGWLVFAGILVVASLTAGVWVRGQGNGGRYHAAGIAQGVQIAYPMNTNTTGFVTLDVSLDASAAVQNVTVVRDVPPLTSAAQDAVKSWQYTPAMVDGQGVAGLVRVNVAFNPYNPSGVGLPGESSAAGGRRWEWRFSACGIDEGELCDVSTEHGERRGPWCCRSTWGTTAKCMARSWCAGRGH